MLLITWGNSLYEFLVYNSELNVPETLLVYLLSSNLNIFVSRKHRQNSKYLRILVSFLLIYYNFQTIWTGFCCWVELPFFRTHVESWKAIFLFLSAILDWHSMIEASNWLSSNSVCCCNCLLVILISLDWWLITKH